MIIFSKLQIRQILSISLLFIIIFLFWYFRPEEKKMAAVEKVRLPYETKTFSLDYKKLNTSLVENISIFNKSETWKMTGFYDTKLFFDYPTSLVMGGVDNNKITAFKEIKFDLGKAITFDLILNLQTNPDDLEEVRLIFTDEKSNNSVSTLPKLQKGWNLLDLPKKYFSTIDNFDWTKISRVKLEFIPRPLGKVVVNLAGLRSQGESKLFNDWNVTEKQMLLLDRRDNNISLILRSIRRLLMVATIKEITTASDFSFQASFRPLTKSWSGLFFRGNYLNGDGYYFMVNGIEGNKWRIAKYNQKDGFFTMKEGLLTNFQFELGKWYYLKVETKGNRIKTYISADKIEFLPLGSVTDSEFNSGGVGIFTGLVGTDEITASLFNDFAFEQ